MPYNPYFSVGIILEYFDDVVEVTIGTLCELIRIKFEKDLTDIDEYSLFRSGNLN